MKVKERTINYIQNMTKIRSVTLEIYSTYNGMAYISEEHCCMENVTRAFGSWPILCETYLCTNYTSVVQSRLLDFSKFLQQN